MDKENTELLNNLLKRQIEILEKQISDLTLDFISTHEKYLEALKQIKELESKNIALNKRINKRENMKRIPECDNCTHDGKCQYQDLNDCQCCEEKQKR